MGRFTGVLGLIFMLTAAWLFSTNRKAIRWRVVATGIALQIVFAVFVTKVHWGQRAIGTAGEGAKRLLACSFAGSKFVFGEAGAQNSNLGFMFAFQVLPAIIFIAAFFAILYYFGIMQFLIRIVAVVMEKTMGASGAESLNLAASIVMGQTEAPLTIRPFLKGLTQSEMMVVMTAGMAHVSGAIMVAYVQVAGVDVAHLLTAVLMTAPGAIMMAKLLEPETGRPATGGDPTVSLPATDANLLDAAARGAGEGLQLAFNVAGMLVAFIALVALVNGVLRAVHPAFSLEQGLGLLFRPFALIMGVPWADAGQVGALLGKRMVVNELVAFIDLGRMPELGAKARLIATFALCGFANVSSIAIQVGGIGALVPERRGDLARLGVKAMLAGSMANAVSGCIAGVLG